MVSIIRTANCSVTPSFTFHILRWISASRVCISEAGYNKLLKWDNFKRGFAQKLPLSKALQQRKNLVLVKYYGLVPDSDDNNRLSLRLDFISNGLFRMTQPKFLNDKGSEARLLPYFNEFAPADYAWARKEYSKVEVDPSYVPSKEMLENFFLKPMGVRYGEQFPHMLRYEGFQSMEEFDKEHLVNAAHRLNSFIIEAVSSQLGILSLSKSSTNELMWTHYASEGKGLAVTFDEKHPFFSKFVPKEVSYSPEKRASLTYYKGMLRMNGVPLKNFQLDNFHSSISIIQSLLGRGIDIQEFSERLLYSKDQKWAYEEEARIVCPLMLCSEKFGDVIKPKFDVQLPTQVAKFFNDYSEVSLKQIPFDAFESIIFGYDMAAPYKIKITELVNKNKDLSHLKLKEVRHNIFGELEIVDVVV